MTTKKINFPISGGMQAKAASEITNYFRSFEGTVQLIYKTNTANAKSIISLLSVGVSMDEEIEIKIESKDEEKDINDFIEFLKSLNNLE